MARVKLKSLKVDKLRNISPGTELKFHDGINVLLGRNGTGKTTLLRLIGMILQDDLESLAGESFAFEWAMQVADAEARFQLQHAVETTEPTIPGQLVLPDVRHPGPAGRWTYRCDISAASPAGIKRFELDVTDDRSRIALGGQILREERSLGVNPARPARLAYEGVLRAVREKAELRSIWNIVSLVLIQSFRATGRFDESIGAFESLLGSARLSHGDLWNWGATRSADGTVAALTIPAESSELLSGAGDASSVSLRSASSPFLQKAVRAFDFSEIEAVYGLLQRKPSAEGQQSLYGPREFLCTLPDGTSFNHEALSYGQKRLLAFLYLIACDPDAIIADELVNGLHHSWIDLCIDEIGDRQAFLTSQNPLLLDYLTFESSDDARRSFVLCRRMEDQARSGLFTWSNMSEQQAAEFFSAYSVGLQYVGEILRTKGLW